MTGLVLKIMSRKLMTQNLYALFQINAIYI